MEQKSNTFLETEKIGRLMQKYAIPCIISLLVAALYNIVDQIFIANADYLGSYGNAANTVVFPLTVLALAIAVMIGDGCCAFVSISLGAGSKEAAHKSIGSAILLCIISGVLLTIVYLLFQEQILTLFGGRVNEETFYHAKEYFFWITLAVLGIVMKFFQIVISIAVGLSAGCIPIVGYNIGAGRKDRAKSIFTRLLITEALVGLVSLLIVELFPRQLIGIFGAANESSYYTDFAIKSFRVYLCMMVLATVNKGTFIYLQSLGKAMASTIISLTREVVFGVGFALLLPRFFGLDGLLYSFPTADILTFVIAAIVIYRTYHELNVDSDSKKEPKKKEA